jgi:hypothetical protein
MMTRVLSLLAGMLAGIVASAPASADPKALVELFTSQGCSSCVSADAYFAELAKRDDVVAISLHVDYWDYLGWRDTLGDAAYTTRQRDYAAAHGTRRVYTPQIVVNGVSGYVGSDRRSIEAAIKQSSLPVPVTIRHGDGTVEIEVAARPDTSTNPATIRLVLLTSEAEVAIARGENAGRTIEYYNVVREIRPIGMWGGEAVEITLPEDEIMADGVDTCAILVQEDLADGPGAIIGAAMLHHW